MTQQQIAHLQLSSDSDKLGENLSAIRSCVREVSQVAGLDKKAIDGLILATDEIATNILNYGYGNNGIRGILEVKVMIDDNTLTIIFEDTSPPFNPLERPFDMSQLDDPLIERDIGGLGIKLAKDNVDKFDYVYENNRNRNIFIVKRPKH
jgi:serine/threonine-protein kinase RsbW